MKLLTFDFGSNSKEKSNVITSSNAFYAQLTKPCSQVTLEEAKEFIKILEKELSLINQTKASGIGLAAPQIGIHKQVAIVRIGSIKLDLVNPIILSQKEKIILNEEGCLSFPGIIKRTTRYNEIVMQSDIAPYRFLATGLVAHCCQHEFDHLNQKTIFDREL